MHRRNVIKAAGVTSTLPFVSGVAAGDSDDGETESPGDGGQGQEERECPRPNCIHPILGFTGFTPDEQLPAPLRPDHEVDLLIQPPAGESDRQVPEFYFEPTGLAVDRGDVVRFNLATPDHTVTAYHPGLGREQRVPDGVPPFSSPVLAGGTFWLYRFDQSGVYDVLCAPHEVFGMVARIVVGEWEDDATESDDESGDGDEGDAGTGEPLRPPALTAALVYQDPVLDPANIVDAGQVSWDDLDPESKRILIEFPEGEGE